MSGDKLQIGQKCAAPPLYATARSPDEAQRNPGQLHAVPNAGMQAKVKIPGFHFISTGLRWLTTIID